MVHELVKIYEISEHARWKDKSVFLYSSKLLTCLCVFLYCADIWKKSKRWSHNINVIICYNIVWHTSVTSSFLPLNKKYAEKAFRRPQWERVFRFSLLQIFSPGGKKQIFVFILQYGYTSVKNQNCFKISDMLKYFVLLGWRGRPLQVSEEQGKQRASCRSRSGIRIGLSKRLESYAD